MKRSDKRTPKARSRLSRKAPASGKGAGGALGDGLRARLRALIRTTSASQRSFATKCGIQPPRLTEWLTGDQLPRVEFLWRIARRTGVSLDWLLLGGSDSPLFRDSTAAAGSIEVELATVVRRHIHRREAEGAFDSDDHGMRVGLERWIVDGAGLLKDLCELEEEKVRSWLDYEERTEALRAVASDIVAALTAIVPHLPRDDSGLGAHIYQLGRAAWEARNFASGIGVPPEPNSFRSLRMRDASHPVLGPPEALDAVMAEQKTEAPPDPLVRRLRDGEAKLAPPGLDQEWD